MLITRLIVLAAIAFAGHASAAGVLNDYLNFTGPLPSGWTAYLHPQASGTGFEYTSGKFEVNAYNTGAFLEKSFDPDNRLEFIDVTYSTLATQSTFLSGVANYLYNAQGQQIAALGVGSTTDRNFQTRILASRDTGTWYSDAVLGPVNGEVLVHERFSDGLEQIVAALASDPSVYQRLDLLLPGFAVRDVAKFQMYAGTTTGNPVWIDDLSVASGESSVISRALKATASSLSDLFSETAKLLAIESTYLSYLSYLTSADVRELVKSLLETYLWKVAETKAEGTHDEQIIFAVTAAEALRTTSKCLELPATLISGFFCGVDTTVNVFGNTIAPELAELGKDPVPPDFTTAYKVVVSSLDIGSQLWQGSFDATHCAEAYLNGVNRSYDRYVAANAANDLLSTDLQFSSIRTYLAKFSLCAQEASMELKGIGAQISGYPWNSGGIDATALDLAKDYIHQNGINAEQEAFFRSLGLDDSDFAFAINSVLSLDALQFQQPFSKLLNEAANEFSSIASAAAPQSTPEPGSMSLAGLALVGLLIAVQRRASQVDYRDTVDLQSKSHHGAI